MRALKTSLPMILLTSLTLAQAQSFPAGDEEHQRLLNEDVKAESLEIRSLRAQIFKSLPANEAAIVNSIDFSVIGGPRLGDQLILPMAQIEEGHRTVVIGQGFIRQLTLFIQEEVYAKQYNKQVEVDRHLSVVIKQLKENQTRMKAGLQPRMVQSADQYFQWDHATEESIFDATDKLLAINLAFIMAHEAGHHVLGHTSLNRLNLTKEQRIIQEETADKWAAKTLISAGQLPLGAAMSLIMFERMYDVGIDDDHPSSDCRIRGMIVSSINALDNFRQQLEVAGKSVEATRREWKKILAALDEDGTCADSSTATLGAIPDAPSGQLASIVAKATQRQLSTLRGRKDSDVEDAWEPKILPEFPMDCIVSYDRDDRSYSYLCSRSYDDEQVSEEAVQKLATALSSIRGVRDSGPQGETANRHLYEVSGVRIVLGVDSPRAQSRHPKWRVHCLIEEPGS